MEPQHMFCMLTLWSPTRVDSSPLLHGLQLFGDLGHTSNRSATRP